MSSSKPPLSTLPISALTELANDFESVNSISPKQWFERTLYEGEKAILAERFNNTEELFIAYVRACQCYSNTKIHPKFLEEKKKDPTWAKRVNDFKESYEAFVGKAQDLKEKLKMRDVEKSTKLAPNGTSNTNNNRPTASRQPSGPDSGSLGSVRDRMRMLGDKGVDVGDLNKRSSRDLSSGPPRNKAVMGGTSVTGGAGTFGVARIAAARQQQASEPSHTIKEEDHLSTLTPATPPAPAPDHVSPPVQAVATGSSARSRFSDGPSSAGPSRRPTISSVISPNHSGNGIPNTPQSSRPILPSISDLPSAEAPAASAPSSLHLPDIPSSAPPRPDPPSKSASADGLFEFEKAFPSLSEFSKQYDDPPDGSFAFERDAGSKADTSGLPNVKPIHEETEDDLPQLNLPDVSGLPDLPSLPSVPSSRSGLPPPPSKPDALKGDALGPPSPDAGSDLKRPASVPNVATLTDSPKESARSPLPPARSPLGPRPSPNGATSPPVPAPKPMAFPTAHPTPGPSTEKPVKPKFPFTNSVDCDTLRSYFLNPAVDVLLLDVRPEDEFQRGYVGVEYEPRGVKIDIVWLDPTVVMRDGMVSTKLEDALSLSTEKQRKAFENRHKYDLVVVYDSHSLNWPRKDSDNGGRTPPLARLWEVIYEHEFNKRLERTPVLLTGGYAGWVEFIKARGAKHAQEWARMQAQAQLQSGRPEMNGHGRKGIPNGHPPPPPPPSSRTRERSESGGEAKKANRDMPVYQASSYAKTFTDGLSYAPQSMSGESSYTGRHRGHLSSPPPITPRSHHSPSPSLSSYNSSTPIAPPPQASLHPGPGARRRSDYVEQHNQAYSGYQSHHARPSIDYPQAHALAQVPQPPPAAQSHHSDRHDARPSVVRSSSIRGLDLVAREGDDVPYWNDVSLGLTGLKNLGNTCYMNSTIQCLSATYPFTSYFLDGSFKRSINTTNPLGMGGNLAKAFAELLKALWKEDYTFLSPVTFRKQIIGFAQQFSGTDQHDSQEFLSFVLDGLHEDLNRIKVKPPAVEMTPEREAALETLPPEVASEKEWQIYRMRNDSFIVDLFQGQYRNRLECLTCHKTSTTYDTFMYLSLPVPSNKQRVVLQELIDEFVKVELLEKEDAWNCPRCKQARRATKTLTISRLPPVLLIQLKRFTTQNGLFWDKSETPVIFPVNGLDLTRYVPYRQPTGREDLDDPRTQIGPFKYDLYGVSNHMGTLSSGHYTAYVKSSKGWMYCEDSKVTKANERDVVSRPAYILFYKRVRV